MPAITHTFDDAVAYEQFMGRWSRPLAKQFLGWLSAPNNVQWLDVGCGTGIFTKLILDMCSPAMVVGIDCADAQIQHARQSSVSERADFRIADAQLLPFSDVSFDVVASALTLNFVPDRSRALVEMRRVARPGGLIAGCVWDFAAELSPSWPVRLGMSRLGFEPPSVTGAEVSSLDALTTMFQQAGFEEVSTTSIDVTASFASFDEFWQSQTPSYAPITKAIARMPEVARATLQEMVIAELPSMPDGRIAFRARANAVRGQAPERDNFDLGDQEGSKDFV
jgi:SAM-dependent methyltransferase